MKYVLFLCFMSFALSVPNISIANFDVREKFLDCWNQGYSSLINVNYSLLRMMDNAIPTFSFNLV